MSAFVPAAGTAYSAARSGLAKGSAILPAMRAEEGVSKGEPGRTRHLQVRIQHEPCRMERACLGDAYEQVLPIARLVVRPAKGRVTDEVEKIEPRMRGAGA